MSAIEMLQKSNAWDDKYGIPNVPSHNNPHIYVAYCYMIADRYDVKRNPEIQEKYDLMLAMYRRFWEGCQIGENHIFEGKKLNPGTFSRFPGGRGGDTSHDEIMGAAYLYKSAAEYLVDYLTKTDGQFSINATATYDESRNQFRFWWLMAFLKACAGYRVSLVSQFAWGLYALYNAFTWKGDCSGTLKVWLTLDKMKKYPLSAFFGFIWKLWMEKKHKLTPKIVFTKYYLTEVPVLGQIALDSF